MAQCLTEDQYKHPEHETKLISHFPEARAADIQVWQSLCESSLIFSMMRFLSHECQSCFDPTVAALTAVF